MKRLLFLLAITVSCVPLYPPPDDGINPLPPEETPPVANDLTFNSRLLELRKSYDLYPWFEPYKLEQGTSTSVVRKKKTHKRSYAVIARELVGVGTIFDPTNAQNSLRNPFDFYLEWGQGVGAAEQADVPILDDLALGHPERDWHSFRNGLLLPEEQAATMVVDAVGHAARSPATYLLWRGYRLWPKGSISPVQHTYPELAAKGYSLEPFKYQLSLDPFGNPGEEQTEPLRFEDEFAIDGILVDHGPDEVIFAGSAWGAVSQNNLLRIDTQGMPLFADWSSIPLVGTAYRRTSSTFAIPLTVPADTEWIVRMKTDFDHPVIGAAGQYPVKLVVYGHKLIKPSAAPKKK